MLSKDVITGALRFLIHIQIVSLKVENPEYICAERQFALSHTPSSIFTRRIIKLEPDECSPRSFCIASMKNKPFNFSCFGGKYYSVWLFLSAQLSKGFNNGEGMQGILQHFLIWP